MTRDNPTESAHIDRRGLLIAGAAAGLPTWVGAQTSASEAPKKKGTPSSRGNVMSAKEESSTAKEVAEWIADQTGEPVHPTAGVSFRFPSSFKLFDGRDFSEAQAKGKLLLIFYWATWCPVCKVVGPQLHDFWRQNRAKGVEVLTLSTDTKVQPAFTYIQKAGWKFASSMADAAKVGDTLAVRSLPTLFVRSKLGVIVNVAEGAIDGDEFDEFLVHL